jgi:hypothetical protein
MSIIHGDGNFVVADTVTASAFDERDKMPRPRERKVPNFVAYCGPSCQQARLRLLHRAFSRDKYFDTCKMATKERRTVCKQD